MTTKPFLFTFDIFGTVCDWRTGMAADVAAFGKPLAEGDFDRIIDAQAASEAASFRKYADITADSLVEVAGLSPAEAEQIGAHVGNWPLYADSQEGLRQLMEIAPCAATTNSDREHGEQIQAQLGFRLNGWVCAEDVRLYKPHPDFWLKTAEKLGVTPYKGWWHVSAYADYDLDVAASLGLTTVFVSRPHARPGPADVTVQTLTELSERLAQWRS